MASEAKFQEALTQKFSFLTDTRAPRERRIFTTVPYEHFTEVLEFLIQELKVDIMLTISGLDEGEKLSFIYHLGHEDGTVLSLKTSLPKANPVLKTVTGYFPGAVLYEREIVDLLGAIVEGLPEGNRYPLPDNFPKNEYPLRKDWKGLASEAGQGEKK